VLASTFTYPSADHYPKNFNTKISKKDAGKFAPALCAITGAPARYRDPLTQLPYSDKEAFKIIRERYFQKEEDKLIVRISVLTDLLAQKRDKLRRYQQAGKNLDLPEAVRAVINAQQQQQNMKKPVVIGTTKEPVTEDALPAMEEDQVPAPEPEVLP